MSDPTVDELPSAEWLNDQWWLASGDDWPIPDDLLLRFGRAVFNAGRAASDKESLARLMAYVTPLGWSSALALIEAQERLMDATRLARAVILDRDALIEALMRADIEWRTQETGEHWDTHLADAVLALINPKEENRCS